MHSPELIRIKNNFPIYHGTYESHTLRLSLSPKQFALIKLFTAKKITLRKERAATIIIKLSI